MNEASCRSVLQVMCQSLGIAAIAAAAALWSAAPAAAQSLGQRYQTPEPRTCASKVEPAEGPISGQQAANYFICDQEYEEDGNTLHLLSNVAVQIGRGTPYGELAEGSRPTDGDSSGVVYPIRGSFVLYRCTVPSSFTPAGQQCFRTDMPHATGTCYRTTFGDWSCNMLDLAAGYPVVTGPPTSP